MPNYEYVCEYCHFGFNVVQSIKDDSLVVCPGCSKNGLSRVIHAAQVFTKGEPTTVAQQADRNMAKMGHYELESKRHEHQQAGELAKKVSGRDKPKPPRPFWRKTDKVDTELAKLAPNVVIEGGKVTKSDPLSPKAVDYIMTGKK